MFMATAGRTKVEDYWKVVLKFLGAVIDIVFMWPKNSIVVQM